MYLSHCPASTGISLLSPPGLGQTHSLLAVCLQHRTGTAGSPDWPCLLRNSAKNTTFLKDIWEKGKLRLCMCGYASVEDS